MTDKNHEAEWSNYWQGRTGTEAGAALVGVGIENDADIAAFWETTLAPVPKNAPLLDLACGAGSVIRIAEKLQFTNLTGADISPAAIEVLKTACPSAKGVVAPAQDTGLKGESFDVIVSQFGFEYAGASSAAPEIARLLRPGGTFTAMAHKTGSAIEAEVTRKRDEAKSIADTHFTAHAKVLFAADNTPDDEAGFKAALANFRPAQDALIAIAKASGGLAGHLYSGTQTLFQNRSNYAPEDINAWLDGMDAEISAYLNRMQSMIDAALSQDDVESLKAQLETLGMPCEAPDIFTVGFQEDELAWIIKARKNS